MSAASQIISALVAGGMDAGEAAGLLARAGVEMVGHMTRKSPGAIRQLRYRERNKASQTVTRDDSDERNETSQSVTSLRSDEASQSVTNRNESVTRDVVSLSKEEKKEESKKDKREGARGCRLPDGWEPPQADLEAAIALLGMTRADDELAKFRDHWKAQPGSRGVKADWPATWRNWYRRAAEYGNRNGQPVSNHRPDPVAGRATAREVQQVTAVGSAALRFLKEGAPTRPAGRQPNSPGSAGFFDTNERAKNAH